MDRNVKSTVQAGFLKTVGLFFLGMINNIMPLSRHSGNIIRSSALLEELESGFLYDTDKKYFLEKYIDRFGIENVYVSTGQKNSNSIFIYGRKFIFNNNCCVRALLNTKAKSIDNTLILIERLAEIKEEFYPEAMELILPVKLADQERLAQQLGRIGLKLSVTKREYRRPLDDFLLDDLFLETSRYNSIEKNYVSEVGDTVAIEVLSSVMENKVETDSFLSPKEYYYYLMNGIGVDPEKSKWILWSINGEYIGLSFFQQYVAKKPSDNNGSLCYFGIVEKYRGQGLGKKLHMLSMKQLKDIGVKEYIGSTDVGNLPMKKIFLRNGCVPGDEYSIFRFIDFSNNL